jgi:hypothetical protein
MATNISATAATNAFPPLISPSVAADYKRSHQQMLAAIAAMDELANESAPNQLRLSHTRLRMIRAGAECRAAFLKIVSVLSQMQNPMVARKIEILEGLHIELREVARLHLTTWTHEQARLDWRGYCQSSREVRQLWLAVIDRERALLYPFL